VLAVVIVSFVITPGIPDIIFLTLGTGLADWIRILAGDVVATLTAPFQAHLLSVAYYRLTDPDRPAVDPSVRSWPSVWQGPGGGTASC